MIEQLLKIITPDIISQAVKSNPTVVMEALQRFDTFKLIGSALTHDQQVLLSNNGRFINPFLASDTGKTAIKLWADEFCDYVNDIKEKEQVAIQAKIDEENAIKLAKTKKLEDKKLREINNLNESLKESEMIKLRQDTEAKIRAELETKIRLEIEDKLKREAYDRLMNREVVDVIPKK